jgi:hypothetical protein
MDCVYLSSLLGSFGGAIATFSLIHEAPGSLLPHLLVAVSTFFVLFPLLFAFTHKRQLLHLRCWLRKRCSPTTAKTFSNRG